MVCAADPDPDASSTTGPAVLCMAEGCYLGGLTSMVHGGRRRVIEIPLPYGAACTDDDASSAQQQEQCLCHFRLLVAASRSGCGPGIRALLLELVQATDGLQLPSAFLGKLRAICSHLDVRIIVDEVMTCGRVYAAETSLLASDAPQYRDIRPDLVVIGKIFSVGMVLGAPGDRTLCHEELTPRGTTTGLGMLRYQMASTLLCELRHVAPSATTEVVVKHVRSFVVGHDEGVTTWGAGLMIFAERIPTAVGVEKYVTGRLLPTADACRGDWWKATVTTRNAKIRLRAVLEERAAARAELLAARTVPMALLEVEREAFALLRALPCFVTCAKMSPQQLRAIEGLKTGGWLRVLKKREWQADRRYA